MLYEHNILGLISNHHDHFRFYLRLCIHRAKVKSIRPPCVSPCWLHSFTQIHYLMCENTLTSLGPDRQRATARPGAVTVLHWRIDKSNYNIHVSVPALHNSKV